MDYSKLANRGFGWIQGGAVCWDLGCEQADVDDTATQPATAKTRKTEAGAKAGPTPDPVPVDAGMDSSSSGGQLASANQKPKLKKTTSSTGSKTHTTGDKLARKQTLADFEAPSNSNRRLSSVSAAYLGKTGMYSRSVPNQQRYTFASTTTSPTFVAVPVPVPVPVPTPVAKPVPVPNPVPVPVPVPNPILVFQSEPQQQPQQQQQQQPQQPQQVCRFGVCKPKRH
jgi:hypothetical protein